jgi:hypothetical protein
LTAPFISMHALAISPYHCPIVRGKTCIDTVRGPFLSPSPVSNKRETLQSTVKARPDSWRAQ